MTGPSPKIPVFCRFTFVGRSPCWPRRVQNGDDCIADPLPRDSFYTFGAFLRYGRAASKTDMIALVILRRWILYFREFLHLLRFGRATSKTEIQNFLQFLGLLRFGRDGSKTKMSPLAIHS